MHRRPRLLECQDPDVQGVQLSGDPTNHSGLLRILLVLWLVARIMAIIANRDVSRIPWSHEDVTRKRELGHNSYKSDNSYYDLGVPNNSL